MYWPAAGEEHDSTKRSFLCYQWKTTNGIEVVIEEPDIKNKVINENVVNIYNLLKNIANERLHMYYEY